MVAFFLFSIKQAKFEKFKFEKKINFDRKIVKKQHC